MFYLRYIAIYCDILPYIVVSGIHLLYTENGNVVHGKKSRKIEENRRTKERKSKERKSKERKSKERNQSRKKG